MFGKTRLSIAALLLGCSTLRVNSSKPDLRVIAFFTAKQDYEHRYDSTNKTLSYTLNNPVQDRLIVDALLWLGGRAK
jgi:hypothetical protein